MPLPRGLIKAMFAAGQARAPRSSSVSVITAISSSRPANSGGTLPKPGLNFASLGLFIFGCAFVSFLRADDAIFANRFNQPAQRKTSGNLYMIGKKRQILVAAAFFGLGGFAEASRHLRRSEQRVVSDAEIDGEQGVGAGFRPAAA